MSEPKRVTTFEELEAILAKGGLKAEDIAQLKQGENKKLIDAFLAESARPGALALTSEDISPLRAFIEKQADSPAKSAVRDTLTKYNLANDPARQAMQVEDPKAGQAEPSTVDEMLGWGKRNLGTIGAIAGGLLGFLIGGGGIEGLLVGALMAAVIGFAAKPVAEMISPGFTATVKGKQIKADELGLQKQPDLTQDVKNALKGKDAIAIAIENKDKPKLFVQYIGTMEKAADGKTGKFTWTHMVFHEEGKNDRSVVALGNNPQTGKPFEIPVGFKEGGVVYFKDEKLTHTIATMGDQKRLAGSKPGNGVTVVHMDQMNPALSTVSVVPPVPAPGGPAASAGTAFDPAILGGITPTSLPAGAVAGVAAGMAKPPGAPAARP